MGFEWLLGVGTAGTRYAFRGYLVVVAFSSGDGLSLDLVTRDPDNELYEPKSGCFSSERITGEDAHCPNQRFWNNPAPARFSRILASRKRIARQFDWRYTYAR
jgi:hypothetical protein